MNRRLALFALGLFAFSAAATAAEPALTFELYKDAGGDFRWRLKAGNGQVIATPGQAYKAKADAKAGVERIQKDAKDLTFELYDDAKKETRWRMKAKNGQVIATSGQGYKAKADAEKAVEEIKAGAAGAKVVDDAK